MSKNHVLLLGLMLLVCSCQNASKSKVSENENLDWIDLFDGTGTDHWRGFHMDHFPDSGWFVENNELRNDGSGAGGIITKEQLKEQMPKWGIGYAHHHHLSNNSRGTSIL